jgi:carbon storage regulator CsrA
MLVLSRKVDETICIGDSIRIQVVEIHGNKIRIGIEAPTHVRVMRGELEIANRAMVAEVPEGRRSVDSLCI